MAPRRPGRVDLAQRRRERVGGRASCSSRPARTRPRARSAAAASHLRPRPRRGRPGGAGSARPARRLPGGPTPWPPPGGRRARRRRRCADAPRAGGADRPDHGGRWPRCRSRRSQGLLEQAGDAGHRDPANRPVVELVRSCKTAAVARRSTASSRRRLAGGSGEVWLPGTRQERLARAFLPALRRRAPAVAGRARRRRAQHARDVAQRRSARRRSRAAPCRRPRSPDDPAIVAQHCLAEVQVAVGADELAARADVGGDYGRSRSGGVAASDHRFVSGQLEEGALDLSSMIASA